MTDWFDYPNNYSNGTEVDGVGQFFFKYPNFILGGYFGAGICLLIFIISFGLSMAVGTKKALAVAGFISTIFSLYFVRLGSLNITITFVFVFITIIGLIGAKEEGGF